MLLLVVACASSSADPGPSASSGGATPQAGGDCNLQKSGVKFVTAACDACMQEKCCELTVACFAKNADCSELHTCLIPCPQNRGGIIIPIGESGGGGGAADDEEAVAAEAEAAEVAEVAAAAEVEVRRGRHDADMPRGMRDRAPGVGGRREELRHLHSHQLHSRVRGRLSVRFGPSASARVGRSVERVLAEALRDLRRRRVHARELPHVDGGDLVFGAAHGRIGVAAREEVGLHLGEVEREEDVARRDARRHACPGLDLAARALDLDERAVDDPEALGVRRMDLDEIRRLELDVARAPRLRARVVVRELAAGDEDEREAVARRLARRLPVDAEERGALASSSRTLPRRGPAYQDAPSTAPATAGPGCRGARARSRATAA